MVFSQFIVQFNDKSVMNKLYDLLKQSLMDFPEIKEGIAKILLELAKHFQIRDIMLNKKLVAKLTRILIDSLTIIQADAS